LIGEEIKNLNKSL